MPWRLARRFGRRSRVGRCKSSRSPDPVSWRRQSCHTPPRGPRALRPDAWPCSREHPPRPDSPCSCLRSCRGWCHTRRSPSRSWPPSTRAGRSRCSFPARCWYRWPRSCRACGGCSSSGLRGAETGGGPGRPGSGSESPHLPHRRAREARGSGRRRGLTLVAEEAPPALLAVALPGLLAGAMETAGVADTLVTVPALPTHPAPRRTAGRSGGRRRPRAHGHTAATLETPPSRSISTAGSWGGGGGDHGTLRGGSATAPASGLSSATATRAAGTAFPDSPVVLTGRGAAESLDWTHSLCHLLANCCLYVPVTAEELG